MKLEFSAGGVVFKRDGDSVRVLICQHASYHHWGFPKGHIADTIAGETKEAAALREVTEETGITARIVLPLTPIEYVYELQGEKRKKSVSFFLMAYESGDTQIHDHEMEDVKWVREDQVAEKLTFAGEKHVWKEAIEKIHEFAT